MFVDLFERAYDLLIVFKGFAIEFLEWGFTYTDLGIFGGGYPFFILLGGSIIFYLLARIILSVNG